MIETDISKCTGCKKCETVCSFYHTGRVSNRLARIKVLNLYELGIDGPVVCRQCKERYCMKCPDNALTIGENGQIIVSPTLCSLCGACEKNCPVGAINIFEEFVYVCDLCGGSPKCVEACTEKAVTFNEKTEIISLNDLEKSSKKKTPGQKQHSYIKNSGIELRKAWR